MPEDSNIIVILISIFGTIITLLLGIIGVMLNMWVNRLHLKMDAQDIEIGELKVVTGQHTTEIKNIHHRLKGS